MNYYTIHGTVLALERFLEAIQYEKAKGLS